MPSLPSKCIFPSNCCAFSEPSIPLLPLTDFTIPIPPTRWLYEPWIARDALTLLLGEGGSAKTWLSLDLAIAASSQSLWLSTPPLQEIATLYIDEDGQLAESCRRVQRLVSGRSLNIGSLSFGHVAPCGLHIDNPRHYSAIVETAIHLKAELIIFDALIRLHSKEEQDNTGMAEIMGLFRGLMRDTGAGLVLLHHLSKPNEQNWGNFLLRARGASEIINASDTALGLSAHKGHSVLEMCRNRFMHESAWPSPLKITLEDICDATRIVAHGENKVEDAIAAIIKHSLEPLTVRATEDKLSTLGYKFSRGTVHSAKSGLDKKSLGQP